MPLIDVTHDDTLGEERMRRLRELLPDVVAKAVDCPKNRGSGHRT
jgi:hypothetical protein